MIRMTQNMDIVNSILSIPDVWQDIAPRDVEPFDVPYDSNTVYFLVNDADGVIIYHPFRDGWKIHPNFTPRKRGKKAFQAIEQSIQAMFECGEHVIYAEIDRGLPHVIWAAHYFGFKRIESNDRDLFVRRQCQA